jgi:hypothetical protein
MIAPTTARIAIKKSIDDGSLRATDTMAVDFNTLFDFSQVKDLTKL